MGAKNEDVDVWRGICRTRVTEENGWDDEGGRGEEVRKWMRQSYWEEGGRGAK